jgi:hypothetical protein
MSEAGQVAAAVDIGRENGWSDLEILKELLRNEYGGEHRREFVVFWEDATGRDPNDALRLARGAGLIPTTHPPRSLKKGTLQHIPLGNAPE